MLKTLSLVTVSMLALGMLASTQQSSHPIERNTIVSAGNIKTANVYYTPTVLICPRAVNEVDTHNYSSTDNVVEEQMQAKHCVCGYGVYSEQEGIAQKRCTYCNRVEE